MYAFYFLETNSICYVCMEEYKLMEICLNTKCHRFHKKCLIPWLKTVSLFKFNLT